MIAINMTHYKIILNENLLLLLETRTFFTAEGTARVCVCVFFLEACFIIASLMIFLLLLFLRPFFWFAAPFTLLR